MFFRIHLSIIHLHPEIGVAPANNKIIKIRKILHKTHGGKSDEFVFGQV